MDNFLQEFAKWKDVLTFSLAVITLIILFINLRNLSKSIQSQTYQRLYELMINIDRFFIENQDLKPFVYPEARGIKKEIDESRTATAKISQDKPDEDGEVEAKINRDKLDSTIELMVDYFDNVYYQRKCMPRNTFEGFSEFMREVYSYSDELRRFVIMHQERYPQKFIEHISKAPKNMKQRD